MKKFVCAILMMVMLVAVAATACAGAGNTSNFTLNVPCTEPAVPDSQLYLYHGNDPATEYADDNRVYIRHRVTQIDAGETNRMAAYSHNTQKTMGAHWHPSDYGLYPCTSNAIKYLNQYSAAGRGNTNYATKYGLNTITLTGYLDPDLD